MMICVPWILIVKHDERFERLLILCRRKVFFNENNKTTIACRKIRIVSNIYIFMHLLNKDDLFYDKK